VGVAVIGLAPNHPDADTVLARVNRALEAEDPELRRQGLVALGHTARLHHRIDQRALANLRRLLKDRTPVGCHFEVRGEADTYAADVWAFIAHQDLPRWLRRRQHFADLRWRLCGRWR
jgi:HEAT repeat protein